jgi:beta-glucanase (GH16 family)
MKKIYLLIAIMAASTVSVACSKENEPIKQTPVTPIADYKVNDELKPVAELQLVWADEFDQGTMVNTADWTYEKGYVRNGEIQYYTEARPENCRLEEGMLVITGRQETTLYNDAEEFTSASIITGKKHSWKYGRFEIRAKVPAGKGPWPAFWAKGDSQYAGVKWPACGELDIMEYASKDPNVMLQNAIYGIDADHVLSSTNRIKADKPYSDDFHTYSLDWTSRQLTFAIDNRVTSVVDLSTVSPNPYNQPIFILLNLALGASTERTLGGKLDPSCLPVEFRVDYVRIYQSK